MCHKCWLLDIARRFVQNGIVLGRGNEKAMVENDPHLCFSDLEILIIFCSITIKALSIFGELHVLFILLFFLVFYLS